jgi:hypothetical protein
MFREKHGAMVAIDTAEMDYIRMLVEAGEELGASCYKIGAAAALTYGLGKVVGECRRITDKPLINDPQKLVPDYDWTEPTEERMAEEAGRIAKTVADSGVDGMIIYPLLTFLYTKPQTVYTRALRREGVEPFVLGRFTVDGHLQKEGGIAPDDTPSLIYSQAENERVRYFIMPGNRPDEVERFVDIVWKRMNALPSTCLPGYGTQRGRITRAFRAARPCPSYAIIGPMDCFSLTAGKDRLKEGMKPYVDEALSFA